MADNLPKYDNPPVVETVLGIQFDSLAAYTAAHAGWFWREYLQGNWPTVVDASRIDDIVERFDAQQEWVKPGVTLRAIESRTPRTQLISQDDERMVQIQDSRLHYNWRKRESDYPSYNTTVLEFAKTWEAFQRFCVHANLGKVVPNLWEVTYVNHIYRGGLWDNVSDWYSIFSKEFDPSVKLNGIILEDMDVNWRMRLGADQGRLHIRADHIRVGGPEGPEALRVKLTARGPLSSDSSMSVRDGLDLGHRTIVQIFTDMTSDVAHQRWKRRQ